MAPPAKFTDEQLKQYVAMGFTQEEIARMFKVTQEAVCKRIARLEKPAAVALPKVAQQAQASVWDVKAALEENYKGCLDLLATSDADPIRVRSELRQHISLSMNVLQTLYTVQEVQAFQEEVLTILDECEPGLRERILSRLNARRTVRAAFANGAGRPQ